MLRIYIPTLNRVGKQTTFHNLSPKLRKNAVLVIRSNEQHLHPGLPVLVHPSNLKTIGQVRQWIVDQHNIEEFGDKIIMLDDDLNFYKRREDDIKKFEPVEPSDMDEGFKLVEKLLATYPHVGIRHREMAQDAELVEECTRSLRALAYNVKTLRKENARFDRTVVMEDFDVTLQLLRAGYRNAVISSIIQNQGSSNAPGGCSTYRTMEVQNKGAQKLKRLHSDFVKLVTKTTKTAWGGQERTDVVVAWKKAFASACAGKK